MDIEQDLKSMYGYRFGRIDGALDAQGQTLGEIKNLCQSIDGRLRKVETRAASYGALMGLSAAIIVDTVKTRLGLGG